MQQVHIAFVPTAQVRLTACVLGIATAHGTAKTTNAATHTSATLTECSNIYNMAPAVTYAVVTAHTTTATAHA